MGTTSEQEPESDDIDIETESEAGDLIGEETDDTDDDKDFAAVYALIAILIIIAMIGLVMYLLHYKGKLPQTFYNLGRKQWKLVQPNETNEAIIDDDEKKHPEIVKNGKKLENEDVESAKIDPDTEKVAYTSEKKPESNGNGNGIANGPGNGTAPGVADLTVNEETADTEASEAKKAEESEPLKEQE